MIQNINKIYLRIVTNGTQGEPARWSAEICPEFGWNLRYYEKWYLIQLPITIDEIDVQFIITKINFNVKQTLKEEMPAQTLAWL